jgi:IS1 family transposase
MYTYRFTTAADDKNIVLLNNEGMSISSISRYLHIAKTTLRRRLLLISKTIAAPCLSEANQVYEVDEIQTYVGRNHPSCYKYITYALNRSTKSVIDFIVGARTKECIRKVIDKVLALNPRKIYTDGLNIYPSLIPAAIHHNFQFRTNTIERNNLTIRNSLKRLSRKTICFSKSIIMLEACIRILLWG